MRHRIGLALYLDRALSGQLAEAQFAEQRQEPAIAREAGLRFRGRKTRERLLESTPSCRRHRPRACDGVVDTFTLGEVVVAWRQAFEVLVESRDAREQVGRQKPALGGD